MGSEHFHESVTGRNQRGQGSTEDMASRNGNVVNEILEEKDVKSIGEEPCEAFRFFALPLELRNKVYESLLTVPYHQPLVTFRRTARCPHILQGLSFLRTCQQVHEEATAVLYGSNAFYFDDEDHYVSWQDGRVDQDHETRGEAWCLGQDKPVWNWVHQTNIDPPDYTKMYGWLSLIGEKNRCSIKHMQLDFSEPASLCCMADQQLYSYDQGFLGGDFLCRALNSLSKNHGLQTLKIIVSVDVGGIDPDEEYRDLVVEEVCSIMQSLFFRESGVRKALATIKGIRELRFANVKGDNVAKENGGEYIKDQQYVNLIDWLKARPGLSSDFIEKVGAGFKELRAEMQSKSHSESAPSDSIRFSKVAIDQVARAVREE